MKGNPPSAELQVMQLVFHFTSKEKQPDVQLYIISCVLGKWFDWTVRDLKENNWKVDYAETGERGMWKYFSEWVRICEDICLCLIRVWPQQRTVLIIKQIGWLVLWLSQHLSPATPVFPMGSWTKQSWWEVRHGLSNMDFHSSGLNWL